MRVYFVEDPTEDGVGFAYVAQSSADAKKMGYREFGGDWIDIKPRWMKDIDVSGLPIGEVEPLEGLRRRIYSFTEGKCPICGKVALLRFEDEKISCGDCEVGA